MASIRKRRLPSGEFRWQFDYRDQHGKRRAKQFRTREQAVAFQIKVMPEVLQGVHAPDSVSITVATACQNWLRRCENEELADSTVQQYRQHVRKHIDPLIGSQKLSRLTTPEVERFVDQLAARSSRAMTRKVLTGLKSILAEAQRQGRVVQNVATPVKVRVRRSEDETLQFLSDPDARSMATSGRGSGMVAYNVQFAVDIKHHLIVAHELTNVGNDRSALADMAKLTKDTLGMDTLDVVADDACRCPAGEHLTRRYTTEEKGLTVSRYWTNACLTCAIKDQCTTGRERRITRREHEHILEVMQQRLDENPGRMRQRRETVEHPFGTIKSWMGYKIGRAHV